MNRSSLLRRLVSRRRPAFTLVELLVVIAIIGVLVGLLLPAVQAAREAARMTKCSNTVRELASAVMQYESVNRRLPHGGIDWTPQPTAGAGGWSWLYFILPFMEEQKLYQTGAVQAGEVLESSDPTATASFPLRGRRLSNPVYPAVKGPTWLRCPSDSETTYCGSALSSTSTNYYACGGPLVCDTIGACTYPYGTYGSPWPGAGACRYTRATARSQQRGMFIQFTEQTTGANAFKYEPQFLTRFKDIRDGQSKTLMLGESLPSQHRTQVDNKNAFIAYGMCPTSTTIPINTLTPYCDGDCNATTGDFIVGNWGVSIGFKSRHARGSNFAFGDGAVRFVDQYINMELYQLLGHPWDGKSDTKIPD